MANLALYDQQNLFGSDVTLAHLLGPDDLCYVIQKEISPLIKDSDFESMYKEGGRPPISPRLLVLVLLMQFLEGLSDRAAARNLKFRLDWKIAFGKFQGRCRTFIYDALAEELFLFSFVFLPGFNSTI